MARCYYTKTKKGKISCIVREHYLSQNISLGFYQKQPISKEVLSSWLASSTYKTIFFLDTNILVHHIDLLETKSSLNEILVLTETVLKELRNLNYSIYKRILSLLKDITRNFIFLPNEHHSEISSEEGTGSVSEERKQQQNNGLFRFKNESVNDAHDRFIVTSILYFKQQLFSSSSSIAATPGDFQDVQLVFVTNDEGNQVKNCLSSFFLSFFLCFFVSFFLSLFLCFFLSFFLSFFFLLSFCLLFPF
jgi:hypothetical protein